MQVVLAHTILWSGSTVVEEIARERVKFCKGVS